MQTAWLEIERLVAANALHRRGFRLQEVEPLQIVEQAWAELEELYAAPDDIDELADTFGVLIHYAVKMGWPPAAVEAALLSKLKIRFLDQGINHANDNER